MARTMRTVVAILPAALPVAAWAQTCQPHWESELGASALNGGVEALRVIDLGGGAPPWLGVGGSFTSVAGQTIERIAAFDGTSWSAIGDGIPFPNHSTFGCCAKAFSLAVFDGGTGPALHIGGDFIYAGVTQSLIAESVTRWQGNQWHALDGGVGMPPTCVDCGGRAYALQVWDDGTGSALYTAGSFELGSGLTLNNIGRWNGNAWHALGSGVVSRRHEKLGPSWISALTLFDDGTGPALYASGHFNEADGQAGINCVARWDGAAWTALGDGLGPNGEEPPYAYGFAMAVFDDGTGPALYVGGEFSFAGGQPASNVARWDGRSWSAVGTGAGGVNAMVRCMEVFDDGTGPALYVGGDFTEAGGQPARSIARWNGAAWTALGAGLDSAPYVMESFDAPQGPTLVVGGWFSEAGGASSPYIARWVGCAASCYADCNASGTLTVADFGCFQGKYVLGDLYADCNTSGTLSLADFGCFQGKYVLGCP